MLKNFDDHPAFGHSGPIRSIFRAPLVGSALGPVLIFIGTFTGHLNPDPPIFFPFQMIAASIVGYIHGLAACGIIMLVFLVFLRRIPTLPKLVFIALGFGVGAVFNVISLWLPFSMWVGPESLFLYYSALFFGLTGAVALWRLFRRIDWVNQP